MSFNGDCFGFRVDDGQSFHTLVREEVPTIPQNLPSWISRSGESGIDRDHKVTRLPRLAAQLN
jgi:hypothetical protein